MIILNLIYEEKMLRFNDMSYCYRHYAINNNLYKKFKASRLYNYFDQTSFITDNSSGYCIEINKHKEFDCIYYYEKRYQTKNNLRLKNKLRNKINFIIKLL